MLYARGLILLIRLILCLIIGPGCLVYKANSPPLQVSHSQSSDVSSGSTTCTSKLSSHQSTVKPYFGRKLSFPRKSERTRTNESGEDSTQDSRPLPEMPDLSQRTLSQPSSPSTVFEVSHFAWDWWLFNVFACLSSLSQSKTGCWWINCVVYCEVVFLSFKFSDWTVKIVYI